MPWTRRKVANLGRVTLDANYTAASGTMELTTGNSAFIPTSGVFWLSWSEDETDPDAVIHIFRVTAVSGDDVSVTAETSEGGGDTNITAGAILRVSVPISAIEMLGMVLLEEHTASSSASLDFTTWYSTTYDTYEIVFVNVIPATDAADLLLRMSTNGGSSYDSGANYGSAAAVYRAGGQSQNGAESGLTAINITGWGVDTANTNSPGVNGQIRLYNPADASHYKRTLGDVQFFDNNNFYVGIKSIGTYLSATAVNAFQFLFTSGNIASGTIRVYGIAKG